MNAPVWKDARDRARAIDLPYRTWAGLATTPESRLHETEVSAFCRGGSITAASRRFCFWTRWPTLKQ